MLQSMEDYPCALFCEAKKKIIATSLKGHDPRHVTILLSYDKTSLLDQFVEILCMAFKMLSQSKTGCRLLKGY